MSTLFLIERAFVTQHGWLEQEEPSLCKYGFLPYFSAEHVRIYDLVERAEAGLRRRGDQTLTQRILPPCALCSTSLRASKLKHW